MTVVILTVSGRARLVVEGFVDNSNTQKFPTDPSITLTEGKSNSTSPAVKRYSHNEKN